MPYRIPVHVVRKLRAVRGETWIKYIALVVSITAIVSAVGAYKQNEDLKNSLISNCVKSRTPLHTYFEGQLLQTENTDYSQFFPNVPQDKLNKLLAKSIANLDTIVKVYDPKTCENTYK